MTPTADANPLFFDVIEWQAHCHILVACRDDRLERVHFFVPTNGPPSWGERSPRHAHFAAQPIRDYLAGNLQSLALPHSVQGTDFQRHVWTTIQQIPYGSVRTYGDVARMMGRPGASRAVGNALGKNPIPIVIPCHRIVAAQSLGGFTGGLSIKRALLNVERNVV